MSHTPRRVLPALLAVGTALALTVPAAPARAATPTSAPPLPSRTTSATERPAATTTGAPSGYLSAAGGVTSAPVSIGDHLYVSTGSTIAAWDFSGRRPTGPTRTADNPEDGTISGIVGVGGVLYATTVGYAPAPESAIDHGGLSTYSLADPAHPKRVASLTLPSPFGYASVPHVFAGTSTALYAVDQYGGLLTYSLADPLAPKLVSTSAPYGNFYSYLNQGTTAAVVGGKLIVSGFHDNENGRYLALEYFDLTEPLAPRQLIPTGDAAWIEGPGFGPVDVGTNAVTITPEGLGIVSGVRFAVFDLRDQNHLDLLYAAGSYPHLGVWGGATVVHGHYAYVTTRPQCPLFACGTSTRRLSTDVWDIANPAKPRLVRAVPIVGAATDFTGAADSPWGPVFVGADDRVTVLDLTRPTAPKTKVTLPLLVSADPVATAVSKIAFDAKGYAYVVGGGYGFSIVDPRTLVPVGRFDSAIDPPGPRGSSDIVVRGQRAYLLDVTGLSVVDVKKRQRPALVSHLDFDTTGLIRIDVQGQLAYVTTTDDVRVVDLSDETTPHVVGSFGGLYNVSGVAARGSTLFLSAQTDPNSPFYLYLLDISDPARPTLVSRTAGCESAVYTPDPLSVSDDATRAYLAAPGCSRVDVFDTSNQAAPAVLPSYAPPEGGGDQTGNVVTHLTLVDNRLAYADTGLGVDLVDLTAAGGPRQVQRYVPVPSSAAHTFRSPKGILLFASFAGEGVYSYRETLPGASSGRAAVTDERFSRLDLSAVRQNVGQTLRPAVRRNDLIQVMLEMKGAPVAQQQAAATSARRTLSVSTKKRARTQLKLAQDRLAPQIRRHGGHVVAQLQSAYNGIQVRVHEKDVAALQALPGVVAVHTLKPFVRANTAAVPYIGTPHEWQDAGHTGTGVKVGIIDSGIDYTHADFGGAGTAEAWQYAYDHSSVDPSTDPVLAAEFGPAALRVKGGYDFAGDAYNAADPGLAPAPDSNPLDCEGHGSHVAGTLGGGGVLADGTPYSGPYDATTISGHDWLVGPGVAPDVDLYSYRVFGCEGSSDVVAAAIDKAVADGMDVINMSLGTDLGGVDDPTTVAAENAARAGVTVVASSGNAGHAAYVEGSPSTGDHVLAVAAIDGTTPTLPGAHLALSTGTTLDAVNANSATVPTGELRVVVLRDASGAIALGCDGGDYGGQDLTGAVLVTRRGVCPRSFRAINGQAVGAAAVVMVNDTDSLPPYEGPITRNPVTLEPIEVTIPFLGVSGSADTIAALLAADGGTVTLTAGDVANDNYRKPASFSSAGPRLPDSAAKPEVSAPGVSVVSAGVGTGTGTAVESGTSMAAPLTAGVAALVKSAHPGWKSAQIKAVIQNTATTSLVTDYSVPLAGTGVVQAQKAVDSTVLATTSDGLNSVSFGLVAGAGDFHSSKTVDLTNTGTSPATYSLAVETSGEQYGADVSVSPASVTVGPGARESVEVDITVSAAEFAALPSNDSAAQGAGAVLSIGGAVVATPVQPVAGQQSLRVAYLAVARGLSSVQPALPVKFRKGSGTLPLQNTGVHSGSASVYTWGISDEQDTGGASNDLRAAGVASLPGQSLGGPADDRSLVFAVNTWGAAATRSIDEVDIAVDNNQDGWVDYFVIAIDSGAATAGAVNGLVRSYVVDANTYQIIDAYSANVPMNSAILELPALASELGIDPDFPRFDYTVAAVHVIGTRQLDSTATASYDVFAPTLSSGEKLLLAPGESSSVSLSFDTRALRRSSDALGWLVVTGDDASGPAQADEVALPERYTRRGPRLDPGRERAGSSAAAAPRGVGGELT